MEQSQTYGLVGERLSHSFSKPIHEELGKYEYKLMPMSREEFCTFMRSRDFHAINVTIPYKELALELCDAVDPLAAEIGAVNTVVNRGGKIFGYNTDFGGLRYLIQKNKINLKGKKVLILGSGGTSRTARAVCRIEGAEQVYVASRNGGRKTISYAEAAQKGDTQVIINTTPVGMYPDNLQSPISLIPFLYLESIVDVVYNPLKTRLVQQGASLGAKGVNGLEMLVAQAKYACDIFKGVKHCEEKIDYIYRLMQRKMQNIVLIGMPGSGKTAFGRELAQRLGKEFCDLDEEIEKQSGMTIPQIFEQKGEQYFRELETKICIEVSAKTETVIATGGGIILKNENMAALAQNGRIAWLKRPLERLSTDGRPVSIKRGVYNLYQERAPLYLKYCDLEIDNSRDFTEVAAQMTEVFSK